MKTLFVVDVQNDFLLSDGKLSLGDNTANLIAKIAAYIKAFKGHVVLTQDTHNEDSCEFDVFPEHCLIGTHGWELVDEVFEVLKERKPISSKDKEECREDTMELIPKASFSGLSLFWTLTEEVLRGEIHVVGVATHVCVHDLIASMVNFSKEKFNISPDITLHVEMTGDFDDKMAGMATQRLRDLYGINLNYGGV